MQDRPLKKILLVNWSWYPTGGDWTYVSNLKNLYEKNGHEVIAFSTKHPKNEFVKNGYFIDGIDYKILNKNKSLKNGFRAINKSIVSKDALRLLDVILKENKIDVAHLHNIHNYLTPAIIVKLKKAGVKVIWTLHDYKILCPNTSFVSNEKICEKCMDGKFYNCMTHKCKKNSIAASTLAALEAYYYHSNGVYNLVDAYLCPSDFLRQKFISYGFESSKMITTNLCYDIALIDNYLLNNQAPANSNEKYILYVGRIEKIKGIKTLISAMEGISLKLKIAGTGEAYDELRNDVNVKNQNNIEFLGFQTKDSVFKLIHDSYFVVCPSEWYENFPYSIIESLLFSKPVIGANIGGIPELVIDEKTGLLFESGNIKDLHDKIVRLQQDEKLVIELGTNASNHERNLVSFENHWNKIKDIIIQ